MNTVAISAISAWLVQMFEVAFSRRMCCSRVASVRQKARLPRVSTVSPTRRPGHLAHVLFLGGDDAGEGTAVARRDGEGLQLAHHDIGLDRRRQQPERHGFGEDVDQQRARGVRRLRRRR